MNRLLDWHWFLLLLTATWSSACLLRLYSELCIQTSTKASHISPSRTLTIAIASGFVPMCGSPLSVPSRCATIANMNSSQSAPSGLRGPCPQVSQFPGALALLCRKWKVKCMEQISIYINAYMWQITVIKKSSSAQPALVMGFNAAGEATASGK